MHNEESPIKQIQFDAYQGWWIGFWDNTILWVEPNTEDIKYYKVPRWKKGHTFNRHRDSNHFSIKLANNEVGDVIGFFTNAETGLSFGLVFNDPNRSQWTGIPQINDVIDEGDETDEPD